MSESTSTMVALTGVRSQHRDYLATYPLWKRCRDAASGGDAVKAAKTDYLPKLTNQTDAEYNAYQGRALFYNATWRTIDGLTGMLYRKDPIIAAPNDLRDMLEDVTMDGRSLVTFAKSTSVETFIAGRGGILVDYPQTDATGTRADIERLNLRPYLQYYPAESVYNWRTGRVNNRTVLTQVRIAESAEVSAVAEFDNPKFEKRYRVLDLVPLNGQWAYRVRVYKVETTTGTAGTDILLSETIPLMRGKPIDFIPFYFIGTEDLTPTVDVPPLIDLVDANLNHYQLDADYKNGVHYTGAPTLYVAGYRKTNDNEKFYLGSSTALVFPDPQAKAAFAEFTGQGLGAMEKALDRLEQQMAILGARMLSQDRRQVEAAETAQIHRAGEQSILAKIAGTISDGLTRALATFRDWAGSSGEISIALNRDFVPVSMTPQELVSLVGAWQQGAISGETLFYNLQQGEIIQPGITYEEEQARIEAGGMALAGGDNE